MLVPVIARGVHDRLGGAVKAVTRNATTPRARGQNPDTRTPRDLLDAIEARFGRLTFDLAATAESNVTGASTQFFGPEDDALSRPWPRHAGERLWLNPPFDKIGPWAAKCVQWVDTAPANSGARLLLLVPASVDSVWWHDSVRGFARVLALAPRVTFVGHAQPFPKAMALCVYDPSFRRAPETVERWHWKGVAHAKSTGVIEPQSRGITTPE